MPASLTLVADNAATAPATAPTTAPARRAHPAGRAHPTGGADPAVAEDTDWVHRAWIHRPRPAGAPPAGTRAAVPILRPGPPRASLFADERGAVTAEYAIVIDVG